MRSWVLVAIVLTSLSVASSARADDDTLYTCKPVPAGTKISASFAPGTSVHDLAVWVSGFTCKNVVMGAELARCAARVDLISPVAMTPKQAVQLFVDAADAVGLVVTVKADTIVIKLGPDASRECNAAAPASAPGPDASAVAPPPVPTAAEVFPDIKLIDDGHATIRRAFAGGLRADPTPIVKSGRIVPSVKDGKANGLKLYAIRPSSLWAAVGLANGDTVTGVNGAPTLDLDQAAAAFEKAAKTDRLVLDLVRRGKPMTLTITVVP